MQAQAERLETVQGLRPGFVRPATEMLAVAVFTSGLGLDAEDAFDFIEHDGGLMRGKGKVQLEWRYGTLNEKGTCPLVVVIELNIG